MFVVITEFFANLLFFKYFSLKNSLAQGEEKLGGRKLDRAQCGRRVRAPPFPVEQSEVDREVYTGMNAGTAVRRKERRINNNCASMSVRGCRTTAGCQQPHHSHTFLCHECHQRCCQSCTKSFTYSAFKIKSEVIKFIFCLFHSSFACCCVVLACTRCCETLSSLSLSLKQPPTRSLTTQRPRADDS